MNLAKRLTGRRNRSQCPDHSATGHPGAEPRDAGQVGVAGQADEHAEYMSWVATTVGKHGWAISGRHGDRYLPPWAYSVGMWLASQATELVVCGLPVQNGASIINALGARISDGADFGADDVVADVCPATLTFRPVHASWRDGRLFPASDAFYGMVRPPYLQVVWSDKEGRFPGEAGFSAAFDPMQPLLWLPRDDNPPSPWTHLVQTG